MTVRPSNKIEKALLKIGFKVQNNHHKMFILVEDEKIVNSVRTRISHGTKDYGDPLLLLMAKQLYLTKKQLLSLIDGEMDKEEYINLLRIKGII